CNEAAERLAAVRPLEGHWREERSGGRGTTHRHPTQHRLGAMEQGQRAATLAWRPDGRPNRTQTEGEAIGVMKRQSGDGGLSCRTRHLIATSDALAGSASGWRPRRR